MVLLNTKQKLALLSLYSEEIKKRLAPLYNSSERPAELLELLGTNEFDEILVDSSDDADFTHKLWEALMNSPLSVAFYDTILHYLSTVDVELHSILCCISEKDSRSQFSKVLLKLEEFRTYLDVDKTLEFLKGIRYYREVVSRIEKSLEGVDDITTKKRLVLRTIPLLGDNAIYDLMRSIYYNSEQSTEFVNKLHPNFLRFYELLDKERDSPRGIVTFCPSNVPISDVIDENSPEAKKYKVNLNYEDLPSNSYGSVNLTGRLLKSIDERSFAETPILLREYQKELSEKALNGINTIIAAPTGSGKTIVAVNIIKNHLDKNIRNGRRAKVLFMTPNTVILDQQADSLRKYLGHRYQVLAVRGSDNIPLREIINAKDVIVATPQLVVNLLMENTVSDGIENAIQPPFSVTVFTLMVFDECHNAVKNSPYSMLMRFYHRLSFSQRIPSKADLPQIIGLTASLGVGGKSTEKEAIAHVVKLCAMLNCKVISTVRKNEKELMKFSPLVFDEICFLPGQDNYNRTKFLGTICELMRIFEKKLDDIYKNFALQPARRASSENNNVSSNGTLYRTFAKYEAAPEDKTSQSYLNWVSNHLRRLMPETKFSNDKAKIRAIEVLEILEILYRAIEMFEDFSSAESFKYLEEQMTLRSGSLTSFSREHWSEYSATLRCCQTSDNILISELVNQLRSNSGQDSRAIVFIRTRKGASVLAEMLNRHPGMIEEGIRVECIAGLSKGSCETTTKREQMEKLRRFRDGETRVLVATSVADEGLDVAKCNLVIKYNCATNEIAHVQRRGRGRAENSRSILITQNLKMKEQEERNVVKENRIDLVARVEEGIKEILQEMQREDANVSQRLAQQKISGKVYRLLCSKCDAFLCTSRDIKTYKNSQYCVCDPSFWEKTRNEVIPVGTSREEKFGAIAKLHCVSPNCQNVLGRIIHLEQTMMPVLSAHACVFEYTEGALRERKTVRKWLNVKEQLFIPDEIRNYDLAAMNEAAVKPSIPNFTSKGVAVRLF
nr:Restriction endonuclease and DNA RNA helicase domain containing protein [Haemonchus contortus]CDJ90283.1 Restriction endonuclease and DNA RNA helicase domain containing protein [Haemonchus contortus]